MFRKCFPSLHCANRHKGCVFCHMNKMLQIDVIWSDHTNVVVPFGVLFMKILMSYHWNPRFHGIYLYICLLFTSSSGVILWQLSCSSILELQYRMTHTVTLTFAYFL